MKIRIATLLASALAVTACATSSYTTPVEVTRFIAPEAAALGTPSTFTRFGPLAEIANVVEVYHLIEPGKESTVGSWADAAAAEAEITAAIARHEH